MEEVCFLERHMTGNPGGGADVNVRLVILDRARTQGRGLHVGRSHDHRDAGLQSEFLRGFGKQWTQHVGGGIEVWEFFSFQAGHL